MKSKWLVIITMVLTTSFAAVGFALADEDNEKQVTVQIPATATGIWQEIKTHEEKLSKMITDKKLDKVHEEAYGIRDLVNALPEKSANLSADKLNKVKSNAKYVADIAKRLDESGDANDQAATEANFKKLQNLLKAIEDQYPSEELK